MCSTANAHARGVWVGCGPHEGAMPDVSEVHRNQLAEELAVVEERAVVVAFDADDVIESRRQLLELDPKRVGEGGRAQLDDVLPIGIFSLSSVVVLNDQGCPAQVHDVQEGVALGASGRVRPGGAETQSHEEISVSVELTSPGHTDEGEWRQLTAFDERLSARSVNEPFEDGSDRGLVRNRIRWRSVCELSTGAFVCDELTVAS